MSLCGICLIGAMYQGQLEHRKKIIKLPAKLRRLDQEENSLTDIQRISRSSQGQRRTFLFLQNFLDGMKSFRWTEAWNLSDYYGPCMPRSLNFILQPARGFSQASLSRKVTCSDCLVAGLFWHQCRLKGQY